MNTTIIIRQIKEYTGAYGKAYTLLYLIGAVAILTSCVKDDLYDTPHPDRGAVVVTTDWSGKSTPATSSPRTRTSASWRMTPCTSPPR